MRRKTNNQIQACADRQPIRFRHAYTDNQPESGMRRQTANQVQACTDRQPIRSSHSFTVYPITVIWFMYAQTNGTGSGRIRQTAKQVQAGTDSLISRFRLVQTVC